MNASTTRTPTPTIEQLLEVVKKGHNADQMSNLKVAGNVITFDWVEYSTFSIRVTLQANGTVLEETDCGSYDNDDNRVYDDIDAYAAMLVELFGG